MYWPEYPETVEGYETFAISPLKEYHLGSPTGEIQYRESLVIVTKKYHGSPACINDTNRN